MPNLLKVSMFMSLLVLLIGCFIACSNSYNDDVSKKTEGSEGSIYDEDPETQEAPPPPPPLISFDQHEILIEVEPNNINLSDDIPEFIKITVHNMSDEKVYRGGYHYSIEFYDGSEWTRIYLPMVNDDEVIIEPNGKLEIKSQLSSDNYRLRVGQYRVKYSDWYGEFSIR